LITRERLLLDAPTGALTLDLRSAFAAHKSALLEVLWRLQEMRRHCFSCGDPHEHPDAYGRCGPCDIASDVFYATRHADGDLEVVA
jgi:hypothetical protein